MRWLLPLLLVACAPTSAPLQAETPTPVSVATAAGSVESRELTAVPEALSAALLTTLESRNLQPTLVAFDTYGPAFDKHRTTPARLRQLVETGADSPLLVLCEATPRFDTQMNGRFRWVVDVTLSVARPDQLDLATVETFDVPVFLSFHHERESEALGAAAPIVQRRLGRLLDGVLGGL